MRYIDQHEGISVGPLPHPFGIATMPPRIQWTTAPNGTRYWLVTEYKLARKVLADRRFRRQEAAGPKVPKVTAYNPAPGAIISLDDAEHLRMRGLVSKAFTQRRIALLTPYISTLVGELLDGLQALGPPADFVPHVSAQLPFRVLCYLLGVPEKDRAIFGSWVNVLFRLVGDNADGREQAVSLVRYMTRLIATKRREPGKDLISELLADGRDKVTDRELITLCLSLLMAGYDSTVDQLTLCVLQAMLTPGLLADLQDEKLVPRIAEELLRINPAPYVTFPRMALEPATIGGMNIAAGDLVVVFIMGANRDPATFAVPAELMLERKAPAHLTFGHGVHRCLGAPLARLQLMTLLNALAVRFPGLQLACSADALDWKIEMATRGLTEMYVSWLLPD